MMETLSEYYVGPVKITIAKDESGICKYIIDEPKLSEEEEKIKDEVISKILYLDTKNVDDTIIKMLRERGLKDEQVEKMLYYVKRQMSYDVITPIMLDPDIEEIECRGYNYPITIVHRQFSECIRLYTNITLENDDQVIRVIERLASKANKSVNIAKPYLEFALPEGHRVATTIGNEISLPGSTFSIRKFPAKPLSITGMISNGMLNELIASYLWFLMEHRPFILILGPTGGGKTSLLNALLNMVNPNYKILTIEDTPEINIVSGNWVRFMSRTTLGGNFEVSLNDLAKLSLRYRPDYLVIGEVRGKEIEALIHGSASGHASLSTFHGARPIDAVTRISSLLSTDLAKLFLQTIWAFIIVGSRKEEDRTVRTIMSIYETVTEHNKTKFKKVIQWDFTKKMFTPSDVASLVKTSSKLKWITKTYGLSNDDVKQELQRRADFLNKLVNEKVIDFLDVSAEIRKFYIGGVVSAKTQS